MIIGLDPSLTSFGVVCLSQSGDVVYNWSVSSTSTALHDTKRIIELYQSISYDLSLLPSVTLVCFEDYGPIGKFAGKITQRAELCGLLKRHIIVTIRAPIITVSPTSLKKYATGSGRSNKEAMLSAAARSGFFPDTADEADAFFAARLGYDVLNGTQPDCAYNRVNVD